MENMSLQIDHVFDFVSKDEIYAQKETAEKFNKVLHDGTGRGNDYLGWINLPSSLSDEHLTDLENASKELKSKKLDFIVAIGIGGSYLGPKAVIEALSDSFAHLKRGNETQVLFAGQNIGEDYLYELRELLADKEYALVVISKSGTTTEPALAFRLLKEDIEKKYGREEAQSRIVAITDEEKGALLQLATSEGYKKFYIPDNVGGRFSVLTPVGLLIIACAGFDIRALVQGAVDMEKATDVSVPFEENSALIYAATRNLLYDGGKKIEVLVNYNPKLHFMSEWWKQLYAESEGKEGKGIYPASVNLTADLHSLGQFIQQGERILFETVISVKNQKHTVTVPSDDQNLDKLNYLAGKRVDEVNKMAELGTRIAHVEGGVPVMRVEIPEVSEYYLGQLIYFFEKAVGVSGYILGINPFDQPGVEDYKGNMFALLEKPGYEEATKAIKDKI